MAYPNTTSQNLHTLKINKVPNEETFEQMQEDNLVNANELYLVEGDNTATLNVESPITYIDNTIGFDGYDVTTTTTTLCNETVTTNDQYNPISGDLVYSNIIDADPIKVTFNGVEYICPRSDDSGYYYYGAANPSYVFDFSEYPFGLQSGGYNMLITQAVGTYTVKIETITDNITVSSDFAKARGYSIVENPSQVLVNESATTTTGSGSTYSVGTISYFSESNDAIKVTFNNVEYICPKNNNSSSYGAQYNSSSDNFDFSTYPFYLEPNNTDGNNFTYIITQTAGTYTVKIESYSTVAMLTEDFKKAINQNFPGDVMIKGIDYVTAGQKSDSSLGYYATAEGQDTTASGSSSHAEGYSTTASGIHSHAEGALTTASNSNSHAEGSSTTASGASSHAEGSYTTANHKSQHVFGEYNVLDTSTAPAYSRGNYVEIVGKGTSNSARSNARTLDWNGNEVLAGKLTVGASPTANMDVATKQYVDNAIPTKTSNLTNDSDFISLTSGDSRYVRQVAGLNSIKYTTNPSGGTITLHAADTGSIDFALSADANGLRKATISTNDITIVTFGEGNGGSAYTTIGSATTTINSTTTTINGVVTPTADGMAANKKYVDDSISAINTGTITGVSVNGTSVATSGVANIISMPASILSGAIPSGVTATTQANSDNSTKIATTAFVKTAISGLIGPMMFKGTLGTGGTITTLPTAAEANTGFTYKVITDGTYASIAAKVGDLFISNGSEWIIVPSGDETFVPTLTSTSDGQGHVTLGVTVGPMVNGNTMSF